MNNDDKIIDDNEIEIISNDIIVDGKVELTDPNAVRVAFEESNSEKYKMWTKKVNLDTPQVQVQEQKDFQTYLTTYGEKIYSKWQSNINKGNVTITPEQNQFNNYIALLQNKGNIKDKIRIVEYTGASLNFDVLKGIATTGAPYNMEVSKEDFEAIKKNFKDNPSADTKGYIFMYIPPNKINNNNSKISMTIYCYYLGTGGTNEIRIHGIGYSTAIDSISGQPQPPLPPVPPTPQPVDIEKAVVVRGTRTFSYDQLKDFAQKKNYYTLENDDILKKLKKNDYVIITYKEGQVSDRPKMTLNIYGKYTGNSRGVTNEYELDGKGHSVGIKTLTEDEIKNLIEHSAPPSPPPVVPTGNGNLIKLPELDRTVLSGADGIGQYGLNLIDYRYMSRSPQIGVAGQYIKAMEQKTLKPKEIQYRTNGKWIYNKYKHTISTDPQKLIFGGSHGLSGIKKDIDLHFDDNWYELKKPADEKSLEGNLKINIIQETLTESKLEEVVHTLTFTKGADSLTYKPTHHGRYQIELGTQSDQLIPSKYLLEFKAHYGGLSPKGLRRNFEFLNYNGIELKANHVLSDKYYNHKLGGVLKKEVGIVKFKDLDWKHSIEVPGTAPHFIYAKVPYDCKVPPKVESQQQLMEELGKKLMTSNLTEISPTDERHIENIPIDKYAPYLDQIITNLPWTHDKPEWCFVLITSPENAKRYGDLLAETEITYELAEEFKKPIYLQQGGFDITLTNGTILHSYDYIKIEDIKTENCYKLTSIDNSTIKINRIQIASVTPNVE